MKLHLGVVTAAMLMFAAPAPAQEPSEAAATQCLAELPVTAALVAEAGQFQWSGADAQGAAPAMLFGGLSPLRDDQALAEGAHGGVLFVRDGAGGWRAMMPSPGENIIGAFAAPATGAVLLISMLQVEGPGQSWTLTRTSDGFTSGNCVEVAFPSTLNAPDWKSEFLELRDLDINARGRGDLIGMARTEDRGDLWFVYRTRDGGATWGSPRALRRPGAARRGLYTQLDDDAPAPPALVEALTAYAAGR